MWGFKRRPIHLIALGQSTQQTYNNTAKIEHQLSSHQHQQWQEYDVAGLLVTAQWLCSWIVGQYRRFKIFNMTPGQNAAPLHRFINILHTHLST